MLKQLWDRQFPRLEDLQIMRELRYCGLLCRRNDGLVFSSPGLEVKSLL